MSDKVSLVRGTLDMLVLRILAEGELHGYAIAQSIQRVTDEALQIEEGSLYPALYRMEKRGWIEAEWGRTDSNRRARFYRLTPAGRERLAEEVSEWGRFTEAVDKVLQPT